MTLCAVICVHDDVVFLAATLASLGDVPVLICVSTTNWRGESGDWQQAVKIGEQHNATIFTGAWNEENAHRQAAYAKAVELGFAYAITIDSDEVLEPSLLHNLKLVAETSFADRVYITWDTYWKGTDYVVRPREPFTPCILINLHNAHHVHIREFEGGKSLFLNEQFGIVHHLSYAGGDERILKKIKTWSHRDEIVPEWWDRVWKRWELDPFLRDVHPTHPGSYAFVQRIETPAILKGIGCIAHPLPPIPFPSLPKASVVIPVHGGQEDLDRCILSLSSCLDYIEEVIVIDNGSGINIPDYPWVKSILNDSNLGFAVASNQGARMATAETILFLNSDTVVPKAGLMRLLESLNQSRTIAAAGPYTNNCGHFQRITPTYLDEDGINLFADSFAARATDDRDTDMLVGFCLAVRKSALDEIGLFDERFGLGTFEDNDLSYRLRRAGYRLVISRRSYIHHEGSKTMRRLAVTRSLKSFDLQALLEENHRKYVAKWRDDLESEYVNHLAGTSGEPVVFNPDNKPESRRARAAALVAKADISLCMIVKNEERVIEECLASASPYFREVLIHDTGSTDKTIEIARQFGAVVTEGTWPDSFALARNQSMKGAQGKWIMWIDADDTVMSITGETIVNAVANAAPDVIGFVVPVRFLEEAGGGTQVDHVKIFRNWPELAWEGRIHEQILPSLRAAAAARGIRDGGQIVRLPVQVLHSGYDTSDAGQKKKRIRDEQLLRLDLADRPNHPFVLFNLGMTAHFTDEHEAAIDWLNKSIAVSGPTESHLRKAYALAAGSYKKLGRLAEAADTLETGLATVSDDPELLFLAAQLDAENGNKQRAIARYEKILTLDVSGIFTSFDPGILDYKTKHNLRLLKES